MVDEQQPQWSDDRELIPFDRPDSQPAAISNFSGDAEEQWRMTAAAMGPSCGEGQDILDQTFPLRYWLCHEVFVNNPERGPTKCVRTVLIDPQGNAYGFVSGGVYDSLRYLVQCLGPGPYDPALLIVVKSRTKGNRRFYMIEPAPRRSEEPPRAAS